MARLSARAVEALHRRPTLASWLFGRRLAPDVLTELEALDEVALAPLLLPFVLDGDQQTRHRVAAMLRALMRRQPLTAVMRLDELSRSIYAYEWVDRPAWFSMSAGIARQLATLPDAASLLGIASFHSSGYVREAAVTAMDALSGEEVLPYLLVRLNDWVTPVADAAKRAVLRRAEGSASAWVACLPIVTRLGGATRRDHADVINAVFAMLRRPANRAALEAGFDSPDRTTRLVSFRLARDAAADNDLAAIIARSFRDRDPLVRFNSIRDGAARLSGAALADVLALAERDPFAPVRRTALEVAVDAFPEAALSRARAALLDRSASVREYARFVIGSRDPSMSVGDYYRSLLAAPDGATLIVALAGITETGIEQDAERVAPFLTHARPAVRAQAIQSLGKLDPMAYANVFVIALSDASPRVARAARDVLEQQPSFIDDDTIRHVMQHGPYAHSRAEALRLADTLGKWPSLILWLEASRTSEPALAPAARERIDRWIARANFRSTAPRPAEIARIQALLDGPDGPVREAVRQSIRGFLQPWSGVANQ